MKTRSAATKESESESGYDSRRPRTFADPPRSPSTIASAPPRAEQGAPAAGSVPAALALATAAPAAAAAGRAAPTVSDVVSAAQAPRPGASRATAAAREYSEAFATPTTSRYPLTASTLRARALDSRRNMAAARDSSVRDTESTIRSRKSCSSDVARVKKAEYEAQKKIAALRSEQLELQKELVSKQLEYEVSAIEAEADAREEGSLCMSEDRVDEWLQTVDRSHPPVADRLQDEQPPHPAATHAAPEAAAPGRYDRRRQRSASRSPTRGERRVGRGIEQLADALEKMIHVRPPRQVTELPTFTGAATEWLPFKAAYNDSSSICKFTVNENLARLRNCIKGEAREAVSALLYSASDPQVIMKTLEQYYGRPEILMDRVMEDLKRLPRLMGAASELNSFAVKFQNIVCVLSKMDNRGYIWNPMLVREVVDKLSPHIKSRWCDYASETVESSREPEVILLSRFLMREADRAMRYAFTNTTAAPTAKKETRSVPQFITKKKSGREAVYVTSGKEDEKKQECLCCGSDHEVPKCAKFLKMSIEERWNWVRTARICFKCVTRRHRREHCRAKRCGKGTCSRPHHALLHKDREEREAPPSEKPDKATDPESPQEAVMTVSTSSNAPQRVLLKVCPVILKGPSGQISTFALLDEGSTISLIDEELARSLHASGPASTLRIQSVTSQQSEECSQEIKLQIRGQTGEFQELRARTIKNLLLHGQTVDRSTLANYPHLRDIERDVFYGEATPMVLIGADNWHLIVTRELRMGKKTEPAASFTQLGWVIHGTAPRATLKKQEGHIVLHLYDVSAARQTDDVRRVEELIKSHFKIDALGVSLAKKVKPEDQKAIDAVQSSMRKVSKYFEVGLPWRDEDASMPNNYSCALRRLKTIEKKMDSSPHFAAQYSTLVKNLLDKGYAQECDGKEDTSKKAWYLPHFPVVNPNKPGKMRLVFDAAHRYSGVCLNDYLLEGPDLLKSLPGILFRFRERPVAVTADIQEMFLQVKIRAPDQASQMFLWRGEERVKPPKKYKMTSMIFGASCSPFIAHSVRDANARLYAQEYPDAVQAITSSHYMDDYVDSIATEDEAIKTAREVIKIHQNAHFNLRGWCSNRPNVVKNITPEKQAHDTEVRIGQREENLDKTLGLLWQTGSDKLGFNTGLSRLSEEIKKRDRAPTKREALGAVMAVYDPLGLISHFTVTGKIVLQNLWRHGIGWDEPLPEEDAQHFEEWMQSLNEVTRLRIPRCYDKGPDDFIDLHVFCDASEQAYAATAYWRIQKPGGKVDIRLVAAKARVAPLKPVTIPRLELQAAVIGARLADTIIKEHRDKPRKVIYWTDSQTVLRWIEKDAVKYTAFVAHRLGEIAELTDASQWRWVPTDHNVADDATRPNYTIRMKPEDRWFTGPAFLYDDEESWPREKVKIDVTEDEVTYTTTEGKKEPERPSHLPDISRFSSYEKLLRATAALFLFKEKCKNRNSQMTVDLIEKAEELWIRQAQLDDYAEEIQTIQKGKPVPKSSSLYKLDPHLDGHVLKVRGRISHAAVSEDRKMPVILHGKHPFTRLLVGDAHQKAGHANNERVINDLRQRYWVVNLRPTVRAIAQRCQLCRIRKTMPVKPTTGDLPEERITKTQRPFTHCGTDYFGPMTVVIGRRHEKRWGALFTCLVTRAVHLELVSSLSTDSALMAIRRMAARRGWPRVMYSDNGTNFRGADAELRAAYKEWTKDFVHLGLEHRMKWKFIPPGAPHMGGAWERLVRSVKTALGATLHQKVLKEETLLTLLTEAEHSINSRPLTHVSVDPMDPEALTPNHFLIGSSSGLPHTGPCEEASRKHWRAAQALADHFWRRWVDEYLPTLVPRGASDDQRRPLRVGDLVVVIDSSLPRGTWPRGVVEVVYSGTDGKVRSADVRTATGILRRPVTKLAVLCVES